MKKKMFYGAGMLVFQRAKYLRNHVTHSEMMLWGKLKEWFPKYRFRRQHPLSNYVADFYCHKLKLVLEVDGSIHQLQEIEKRDQEREAAIKSLGLTIIRFANSDIKFRIEECMDLIKRHIATAEQ